MPQPLVLRDMAGHQMIVRPDVVSALTGRPVEERTAALKEGRGIAPGCVLWALGRTSFHSLENPNAVLRQILEDGQREGLDAVNSMSLALTDVGGAPVLVRPTHVAGLTGLPAETRRKLTMAGQAANGSIVWTVAGHGLIVRDPVAVIVDRMARIADGGAPDPAPEDPPPLIVN